MDGTKKHPTFQNRPVPTFQLLSKLSQFQGERKDIIGKTPQQILGGTATSAQEPNLNNVRNYNLLLVFI
jgi:hypothetical protein